MKKDCPYCQHGAELSTDVEKGDILIQKNNQGQYRLLAQSAPQLAFMPSEVTSIDISFCPICGERLTDE